MKKLIVRYVFMALSAAIMVLIFILSSQNGEQSGELSGWFSQVGEDFFNALHLSDASASVLPYIRKIAHYTLYACLGLCVSICLFTYSFRHMWLWIVIPVAICLAYACSDEIHQLFVEGRDGRVLDVLIDSSGFLTTILLSNLVWFFIRRHCAKKQLSRQTEEDNEGNNL